jgi:hypothetical protein
MNTYPRGQFIAMQRPMHSEGQPETTRKKHLSLQSSRQSALTPVAARAKMARKTDENFIFSGNVDLEGTVFL